MPKNKTKLFGAGIALAAAILFLIIAFLNFPNGTQLMFGEIKEPKDKLTLAGLIVSFFGFIGAISAFGLAMFQYHKSSKWKRMEFIANEVKEFESDPTVQNALLMIDWGIRRINLFRIPEPKESDFKLITREIQWKALLPHTLKYDYPEYQAHASIDMKSNEKAGNDSKEQAQINRQASKELPFTNDEAKIRDTYDVFLTRLDRFATFIKSGLIDSEELRPFIEYWIDSLTSTEHLNKDANWKCTLLTYIHFYKYTGIKALFESYGKDLKPDGKVYQDILKHVENEDLRKRLFISASS